jgi:hypothetical protein
MLAHSRRRERKRTRQTHGSEGRREGARLPARWSAYVDGTIRVVTDVMWLIWQECVACPGWGTRFSARIERGCRSFPIRIPIGEENGNLFLLLSFFPFNLDSECRSCGLHRSETEHFIWFSQVGLIIGRGGETIKSLQSRSGVRIQVCRRDCIHYAL